MDNATMEETTWNKLQIQSQKNIYVRRHLQGRGHIASAALQAAHLDTVHNREHAFFVALLHLSVRVQENSKSFGLICIKISGPVNFGRVWKRKIE